MPRVKRGTTSVKRRRRVLKQTKGYRAGRSTKERQAHEAILHAQEYAFAHRRKKKGDFRRLWQIKIGAQTRSAGVSYSSFISALKKKGVALNRKMLAELAEQKPDVFQEIFSFVTKQ